MYGILKKSSYLWHSGIFVAIHSDLNPRLASGPGPEIFLHKGEVMQLKNPFHLKNQENL
jgi:hypothetical protein